MTYRAALYPQFQWSALQAVEKYLKAILLYNRVSSKSVGHDLGKALKRAEQLPFELKLSERAAHMVEFLDHSAQRRDLDLLREILLRVRESPPGPDPVELDFKGRSPEEVSYHIKLLHQAGFLEATDTSTMGSPIRWWAQELTYTGHEFVDATEDPSVWDAVKGKVQEAGGAIPLEVLKALAVGYVKEKFGLS